MANLNGPGGVGRGQSPTIQNSSSADALKRFNQARFAKGGDKIVVSASSKQTVSEMSPNSPTTQLRSPALGSPGPAPSNIRTGNLVNPSPPSSPAMAPRGSPNTSPVGRGSGAMINTTPNTVQIQTSPPSPGQRPAPGVVPVGRGGAQGIGPSLLTSGNSPLRGVPTDDPQRRRDEERRALEEEEKKRQEERRRLAEIAKPGVTRAPLATSGGLTRPPPPTGPRAGGVAISREVTSGSSAHSSTDDLLRKEMEALKRLEELKKQQEEDYRKQQERVQALVRESQRLEEEKRRKESLANVPSLDDLGSVEEDTRFGSIVEEGELVDEREELSRLHRESVGTIVTQAYEGAMGMPAPFPRSQSPQIASFPIPSSPLPQLGDVPRDGPMSPRDQERARREEQARNRLKLKEAADKKGVQSDDLQPSRSFAAEFYATNPEGKTPLQSFAGSVFKNEISTGIKTYPAEVPTLKPSVSGTGASFLAALERTQKETAALEAQEKERQRLAEIERQKQEAVDREQRRIAEIERLKQEAIDKEMRRLAEVERQKQEAIEKEQRRLAEIERIKQEALEKEHKRIADNERQRQEVEQRRLAEIERQKQEALDKERTRLLEIEKQKQEAFERERARLLDLQREAAEKEKQKAAQEAFERSQIRSPVLTRVGGTFGEGIVKSQSAVDLTRSSGDSPSTSRAEVGRTPKLRGLPNLNPVFTAEGGGHRKRLSDIKGTTPITQPNTPPARAHVAEIFDETPSSSSNETKPSGPSPAPSPQLSRSVGLDRSQSLKATQNAANVPLVSSNSSSGLKVSMVTAASSPSPSISPVVATPAPQLLTFGPEYELLRLKILAEACRRRGISFTPGVTTREQALKALGQKLLAAKTS